jgi:cyanate permease
MKEPASVLKALAALSSAILVGLAGIITAGKITGWQAAGLSLAALALVAMALRWTLRARDDNERHHPRVARNA